MRSRVVIPAESGTCGPARPAAWLFHDRAQLQDPERGSGILRGNLNRLVHVAAFENVEAGDMQRLLARGAAVNAQLTLSRTQIVRASDTGLSTWPATRTPRASISSHHAATAAGTVARCSGVSWASGSRWVKSMNRTAASSG